MSKTSLSAQDATWRVGACSSAQSRLHRSCFRGTWQAFYSAMLALAAPGDEVILPTPWYFNHQMSLNQLGLSLVPLRCAPPSFLPSPAECAQLVTPRTKAIVLVSPNNPTGAIYPPELLRQFAELAQERKVALIVDETYREFVTGRPHDLFAETDWRSYLIHLFSFSKCARSA